MSVSEFLGFCWNKFLERCNVILEGTQSFYAGKVLGFSSCAISKIIGLLKTSFLFCCLQITKDASAHGQHDGILVETKQLMQQNYIEVGNSISFKLRPMKTLA